MTEEKTFFFNSIPSLFAAMKKTPQAEKVKKLVEEFLLNSFKKDLNKKVERFLSIPSIGFIPANTEYCKLYLELIGLYANGFSYSAIVLSGVLCERICYDILSTKKIGIEDKPLSKDQIACLFEMNIASLFKLLLEWNLIDEATMKTMFQVNNKRNEYVHPKREKSDIQKDAYDMVQKITEILISQFQVKAMPKGTVTWNLG